MEDSTIALISSSLVFSCSSSSTKCRTVVGSRILPETSGYVIFGLLLRRILEDDRGAVEFDQAAQQEEAGIIGDARRLLHVVGDDHNGATALELKNQVLDLGRGDGIERRARF